MDVKMVMRGDTELSDFFSGKMRDLGTKINKEMAAIGNRWVFEARKRVPVDTGLLRNQIYKSMTTTKREIECRVGTNVRYAKYVEFGTDSIAKGKVKALGLRDDVTDAQAVKMWRAKAEGLIDSSGEVMRRLQHKVSSGSPQEQMPWLRPAFNVVKQWAIFRLIRHCRFEE